MQKDVGGFGWWREEERVREGLICLRPQHTWRFCNDDEANTANTPCYTGATGLLNLE